MTQPKTRLATVMDPADLSVGELYAQALLELLPEDSAAEEIAAELEGIMKIWQEVPDAQILLTGALLNEKERSNLIHRVFSGRVSEKVEALLAALDRHGRISRLRSVVLCFRKLLNKRQGKIEVTLTTAMPLDAAHYAAIESELTSSLGAKPLLQAQVDEKLLGGAVVRIGDRVMDASILSQLQRIRQLIAARRGRVAL